MCVDRDCGMCGRVRNTPDHTGRSPADRFAGGFVLFVGLVLLFGHLAGVIESIVITLVCVGALVVSAASVLVWWRYVRPRQLAERARLIASLPPGATRLPRPYAAPVVDGRPVPGQLPAANPAPVQVVINLTDEQAAQFLGRGGGA